MSLTAKIKEKARVLGFDLVGITPTEPLKNAYRRLKKLNYFNDNLKEKTEPAVYVPGASTIISVAMSYAAKNPRNREAYIAAYARGRDYHDVMVERMNKLSNYIIKLKGDVIRGYFTDKVPLLEKEIAMRAGLGWIGKNNLLINPEYGSYLVLGEIFTSLKLTPDKPGEERCGDCNSCLHNCSTGALESPYRLNRELCISNITQTKGIIEHKRRKLMGLNLWGCDACQQYCPYNEEIPVGLHPEFSAVIEPDLKQILKWKTLPVKWRQSSLSWRGLRILRRNALINMANSGDRSSYLEAIKNCRQDSSPLIKIYTLWALEEMGVKHSRKELKKFAARVSDERVDREIREILKRRM